MNTFEQDSNSPESPQDVASLCERMPINKLEQYDDLAADFESILT
jgi:hypothetical protein